MKISNNAKKCWYHSLLFWLVAWITVPAVAKSDQGDLVGIWDGRSGQMNVLECGNASAQEANLQVSLLNDSGNHIGELPLTLRPQGAEDLLLNKLAIQNSVGIFRVRGGNEVVCQVVIYKMVNSENLGYAYALPAGASLQGETWGIYDSHHPFLETNAVKNSLTIVNSSTTDFSATVELHGEKRDNVRVSLPPHHQQEIVLSKMKLQQAGYYRIIPDNNEVIYQSFLLRSGMGDDSFSFPLLSQCRACGVGPVMAASADGAIATVEVANPSSHPASIRWETRNSNGTALHADALVLAEASAKRVFLNDYLGPQMVGSFAAVLDSNDNANKGVIMNAVMYGLDNTLSKKVRWAYSSQSPSVQASKEHLVLSLVNTHLGAQSRNYYFEGKTQLSECTINLYERGGTLFAENALRMLPSCNVSIDFEKQTGTDFLGLAIGETDDPAGSFVVDTMRVYPDKTGAISSVMNFRAFLLKRNDQGDYRQLEPIRCGAGGNTLGQSKTIAVANKEQQTQAIQSAGHSARGFELSKENKLDDAIAEYRNAVRSYPTNVCALLNLALLLGKKGELTAAEQALQQLLLIDKSNFQALLTLGVVYEWLNDTVKAKAAYAQALRIDPASAKGRHGLGYVLLKENHYARAEEEFRKAIELDPAYWEAWNGLGAALAWQNKHQGAIQAYQTALRSKPEDAEVERNLGLSYIALGDVAKGVTFFEEVLRREPNHPRTLLSLADAHDKQGKIELAINEYQKAIEVDPKFVDAYLSLGLLKQRLQHFDEASALYKKVISIDPQNPFGPNNLGYIMFLQGKLEEAIPLLEKAVSLNTDLVLPHMNLGNLYLKQERFAEAIAQYELVVGIQPENTYALTNMVRAYCHQGNTYVANRYYERLNANGAEDDSRMKPLDCNSFLAQAPET